VEVYSDRDGILMYSAVALGCILVDMCIVPKTSFVSAFHLYLYPDFRFSILPDYM
jgi:hypothetical protein